MDFEKLGRLNFEAYNNRVGGLTHDGRQIPAWEKLSQNVKDGWAAGAQRVAEEALGSGLMASASQPTTNPFGDLEDL